MYKYTNSICPYINVAYIQWVDERNIYMYTCCRILDFCNTYDTLWNVYNSDMIPNLYISMSIVYTCIYFSNKWNWITSNGIKTIHAGVSHRMNTSIVVKHSDRHSTVWRKEFRIIQFTGVLDTINSTSVTETWERLSWKERSEEGSILSG